ncbi:MAG: hypothetical protein GX573_12385, partial [Chloroflexi bacterium]|nr:hypothetical protein [Chloroflexota bacterium]
MKRIAAWLLRPSRAAALLALALTALLYGDALRLPLFSDDLVQIPWLESVTWRALWTAPSPYGYYRPLWYSLWRVWAALTGGLTPLGLHLLNLLAHALAAWLAGLLAADWACAEGDQPARPAVLGTLFFALFPFAVQAVAWPGAVYNPLVSAMVAGALLAYTRGRGHSDARSRGRWLALALLLVVLAPFTYEEGLLAAPALALCEVAGWLRPRCLHRRCLHRRCLHRRCLRRLTRLAAFAALTVGTLAVWRLARGAGVTGFGLSPADLRRNAAYLVQALVYPAAPLGQRIAESLGLEAELALGLAALPCLAALLWAGLRRSVSATVLGLGWFVLFALPPAVTMAADWFALAPRFLYMTAAGTALLWTLAVEAALDWLQGRAERAPRPRLAQAGALALAGVIV